MKKIFKYVLCFNLMLLSTFCVLAVDSSMQHVVMAETSISDVTLYRSEALIVHTTALNILPGTTEVTFINLPENIDMKSIRGKVIGANTILDRIYGEYEHSKLSYEPRASLEKKREALTDKRNAVFDQMSVLTNEKRLLILCQNIIPRAISEQAGYFVDTAREKQWHSALEMIESLSSKNDEQQRAKRSELAVIDEALYSVNGAISQCHIPTKTTRSKVTLKIKAKDQAMVKINMSYTTTSAYWRPAYEVRANNTSTDIQLTYRAKITQNTGYNWEKVNLTFSSADPRLVVQPPEVRSYWVGGRQQKDKVMPQAVTRYDLAAREIPASDLKFGVEKSSIERLYKMRDSMTIKTGNQSVQVILYDAELSARLINECYPFVKPEIVSKFIFVNSLDFPLLPGVAIIYRDGGLVGNSAVPYVAVNEIGSISSGQLAAIRVSYQMVGHVVKKSGFLKKDNSEITCMRMTFKNDSGAPAHFNVIERVPVSENESVVVSIEDSACEGEYEATTEGYKYDQKNGRLTWDIQLQPTESKTLYFTWNVTQSQ